MKLGEHEVTVSVYEGSADGNKMSAKEKTDLYNALAEFHNVANHIRKAITNQEQIEFLRKLISLADEACDTILFRSKIKDGW
jgi:hypothetical protein